jgi:DNA polymerase/3'-5' exonuclease PolX
MYFTGSKAHNAALRSRALGKLGMKLNEYGLVREADGSRVPCKDEAAIYEAPRAAVDPSGASRGRG